MSHSSHDVRLQVAQTVPVTEAEGPGKRYALWFQGCPLRCPQCCNPEMLSFAGGTERALHHIQTEILAAIERSIEGISLLGGEPFAHAPGAALLACWAQQQGLSVMVYSGHTLEELRARPKPEVHTLLRHTDLLVDGPYRNDLPESQSDKPRRWIGSSNQRVHFLTDRYRADDPCWHEPNTLEVRLTEGIISVNGFPAPSAVGLWKRPTRAHADHPNC